MLHGLKPPPAGKRGRPREKGNRIGACADAAKTADWGEITVHVYGKQAKMQVSARPALWHGSFGSPPGQLVPARDPDSGRTCGPGLFTLGTQASPGDVIERYSCRWAIGPSSAAGKQATGAGDACTRTQKAAGRAVPSAFLTQSLMITWCAVSCDPAAGMERRRQLCPWYRAKATPSAAGMRDALRAELTAARISAIGPGQDQPPKNDPGIPTCDATAA